MARSYKYKVLHRSFNDKMEKACSRFENELNEMGQGWRLVQLQFQPTMERDLGEGNSMITSGWLVAVVELETE